MQEKDDKNIEISKRLSQVIDYLNVKPIDFSKKLGYDKPNVVYETLKGKAKPSFDFWERFFNSEYSKKINGIWVITGNGDMLINPTNYDISPQKTYNISEPPSSYGLQKLIAHIIEQLLNHEITKKEAIKQLIELK